MWRHFRHGWPSVRTTRHRCLDGQKSGRLLQFTIARRVSANIAQPSALVLAPPLGTKIRRTWVDIKRQFQANAASSTFSVPLIRQPRQFFCEGGLSDGLVCSIYVPYAVFLIVWPG